MKNTIIAFVLITSISFFTQAQKVSIRENKNRIADENLSGFTSKIVGEEDDIEGKWYKALRLLGKLREEGNYLTVKEAKWEGWEGITLPVYSKLTPSDSITEVWITIKKENMSEDSVALVNELIQNYLYEFSLNYYKEKAFEKVNEAERAVSYTLKKHQKLENEGIQLAKELQENSDEIIRLKQLLEKNELEDQVIRQKIIDNKIYQDSTLLDLEQLKSILAIKRSDMDKIE